ncbi:hypothetical protein ACFQE8_23115 [Salinirubellus sp. GCM10025818]|uniref:hypothetical protein n=1 Tax=Salinirubellus TaxID=2162630 RepID=UPI0030CED8A1
MLGVLTIGGLGALTGCTTVLGSPKTDATAESVLASGTDAPAEPTSEESSVTSAAPSPGLSTGPEDEPRDTAQAQIIEGPVESRASNVSPYADPVDGLALTNVRLAVAAPFRRDSFNQIDDTISIGIEGERFTATGRGHVEWECDGVQFKTVVVDGRDARVYLETTETDSCRTPKNKAGRGPWSVSFTVTGVFVGGRPDSLQLSIQGPFIENSGVFVTEAL